ncbi:unnamed protein product (macronuclear) [Paramecium tetraurelia]|uniref:Transmembrane protein n=1 Tax=Paramecium tetraurelia TaxID=5888 RepID=A0CYT2_PARTE|nr:uncharacterized protein GSPATT00011550001 [Paramecium tetraurelia]CAK75949.1 unnamed protein product [Paramecium tetraurelia]|eukprot:XP_001443346.1 hypothetical protein (macronuclear) [Paramecium tetraurelia strain d4-2]
MSEQQKNLEPPQEQPDQEQSLLQQALENRQVFDSEIQQQIQKDAFDFKMEVNNKEEDLGMMKRDIIKKRKKREKKEKLISARRLKRLLKKKPVDKIRLVYQAYFFIVSITVLTLSILSYRDQTVYEGDYQQFVDNVNSYVIDDIQFTYTNKNCKTQFGSQYSSLYEYHWPGTKIGCDCSKGFNFSSLTEFNIDAFFSESFMLGRICSQDLLSKNCNTVNEQQPKIFNSWNDGSYGRPFVLCARRQLGIDLQSNQTNCQSDHKVCGTGDNSFCVPSDISCPISEIGFTTNSNYQNLSLKNDTNIGNIFDLGSGFYFYYIKNTSSLPIVEFRVTEGDKVCRRNLDQNISPNRIDYPLMVSMRKQCENTDQLFQVIHSIDEEQFYLSNNVIYLSEKLPYFNIDTKYNWTLHAKTFIPWAPQCRGELFDQVLQEGANLHHVYISLRVQLGVTIAYFIVIGLIFNVVGTMTACNFAWSCMATRPDSQYNYIFLIEVGFKILLQITEIIVIIVSFAIIDGKRKIIKQINDDGCVSDPVSGYFFTNLESDLTKFAWSYNLANLVIFTVTLILDLIIIKHSINQGHHHGAKKHHEKGEHQELDVGSNGESGNQQEIKSDVKLQAKSEPQV